MARLGKAKMERWERDLVKAKVLIDRTRREAGECIVSAKGGRLSDLQQLQRVGRDAAGEVSIMLDAALDLRLGEERRKPKARAVTPA